MNVWAGIFRDRIIEPFFFDRNLDALRKGIFENSEDCYLVFGISDDCSKISKTPILVFENLGDCKIKNFRKVSHWILRVLECLEDANPYLLLIKYT